MCSVRAHDLHMHHECVMPTEHLAFSEAIVLVIALRLLFGVSLVFGLPFHRNRN